jgi:hypothetical protein
MATVGDSYFHRRPLAAMVSFGQYTGHCNVQDVFTRFGIANRADAIHGVGHPS